MVLHQHMRTLHGQESKPDGMAWDKIILYLIFNNFFSSPSQYFQYVNSHLLKEIFFILYSSLYLNLLLVIYFIFTLIRAKIFFTKIGLDLQLPIGLDRAGLDLEIFYVDISADIFVFVKYCRPDFTLKNNIYFAFLYLF